MTTVTTPEARTEEVVLDGYHDVVAALTPGVMAQLADDELPRGISFMSGFLVRTNGEGHRKARQNITTNFLTWRHLELYESLLHEQLTELLAIAEKASSVDGFARADLVDLLKRVQVKQGAVAVGLDAFQDPAMLSEAVPLLDRVRSGIRGAAADQDVEDVLADANEAKDAFYERFILPAWERREDLWAQVQAGSIAEDEMPQDLLTVFVKDHSSYDERGTDVMIREYLAIYASFALSPLTVDTHAFDFASRWVESHPQDKQRMATSSFIRDVVHETIRLRTQGCLFRRVERAVTLPSGQRLEIGQTVLLDIDSANRDASVFGDDAEEFRIPRDVPPPTSAYGLTFGRGEHACIGKAYALGTATEEGRSGAVAGVLMELFGRQVEPDPDVAPMMVDRYRPTDLPGAHLSRRVEEFMTLPIRWRVGG